MKSGEFELLPVDKVELDTRNPRIRRFLEFHEGEKTEALIALALNVTGASTEAGMRDATTPAKLKASIVANGGIRQPIIVNKTSDGRFVCIEGNTRLWIYRRLLKDEAEGQWSSIPALVHADLEREDIDAIRLQAHLVGPRPWDAYSKAKYLWELQNIEMMSLPRIIDLCGGSQRDVTVAIAAYADMESFYRPLCIKDDFDTERYTGFVEYQSNKVQSAILSAGFDGSDFASWIHGRKINNLQEVRQLPNILKNKNATKVFLQKGVKAAAELLDRPDMDTNLKSATLDQLSRAVATKARSVELEELRRYQNDSDCQTSQYVDDALDALSYLLSQIRKED